MNSLYGQWYDEFKESMDVFGDDELFGSLDTLLRSSRNTFAFNKKIMEKAIDVSWVEAIENGLLHVDNVLRNPRRTIEDVEEIVPIALSRKITVDSVKHLAQHTDYIQEYDARTGKITPSKILNIHKEESLMTYENKFVNTLVDRLYIFINTRYEKLAQVAKDEEVFSLGYNTDIDNGSGGKMKIEVKIETTESLDARDDSGMTIWQRVEKLKKAIEGYKGSELCTTLGQTYIRPPVMRTNAIMKNVDLKACLTLWQYIESYDKVGYEINVENSAVKPQQDYIEDFYKVVVLNFLLFRSYMNGQAEDSMEKLKTVNSKPLAPKFVKHFDKELASDFNIIADTAAGYVATDGELKLVKKMPSDIGKVFDQINEVVKIEKAYYVEQEKIRLEKLKAEEEAERQRQAEQARLAELRRIEEAKQAELERIQREKEEEDRRLRELIAQKKAEQEAELRAAEQRERERQAKLEEERKRAEEERLRREEEERLAAERARLEEEKRLVRDNLGDAEGIEVKETDEEELEKQAYESVTEEEIEEAKAAMEEAAESEEGEAEFEDPREVAARMKLEQQRKEKERAEKERAERLKAERKYFENKSFSEIRREYSRSPILIVARAITWLFAMVFGIIPKGTDNPDFKKKLAEIEEQQRIKEHEKEERNKMEVYYKKYGQTFKYKFRRSIDDYKFRRKRKKADKNRPRPKYTPPVRTPEEQQAIDREMQRLYREYHVSLSEKWDRWVAELKRK